MKTKLKTNEFYYRQTVSSIGIAMLILLLLMNVVGILSSLLQVVVSLLSIDPVAMELTTQMFYAVGYLLTFMIPAFVLKRLILKRGYVFHPMKAELHISPYLPVIVLGGIFLIWCQSYLNTAVVSIFNYSAFSSEVLWGNGEPQYAYQIVLQFIVMALVPAFCEEFLFRGAILTNLLPFGRVPAILISSLLFSVMHQNVEQVLYAFAAGILLGVVYERTGSIWNCFFLHLFNNFVSFAFNIVAARLGENNEIGWAIVETALCFVGAVCAVVLVRLLSQPKTNAENGIFERTVPVSDSYAACPIASKQAVRLFMNLPMMLFFAAAILQMILLIGMALVYPYGV